MYKTREIQDWKNIINNAMPQGYVWNAVGVNGTNIDAILQGITEIYKNFEDEYANKINKLSLTADSEFLDDYWNMYDISRFIKDKPNDKDKKYKIINAFAEAKQGIFTSKQLEKFINDVFDLDVSIYIEDIRNNENTNKFPCKLSFNFWEINNQDNTIVVQLPNYNDINDPNILPTEQGLPFPLINKYNYISAIKSFLDTIIDINFKIIYV